MRKLFTGRLITELYVNQEYESKNTTNSFILKIKLFLNRISKFMQIHNYIY